MNRIPGRLFDFLVFTSIFLAASAVLMVWQTVVIFDLPLLPSFIAFVAAGTICSYNFHWSLTPYHLAARSPKLGWNIRYRRLHLWLAFVALAAALWFAWQLRAHWVWLLLTVFFTFLYSAPKIPHRAASFLRRIAIGKTIFLAFAWTHVTAILPVLLTGSDLSDAQVLYAVNRFFFIYAVCILFDYRDREADRRAGVRSLLTDLTERGIDKLFAGSVITVLVTFFLLRHALSVWEIAAHLLPLVILCLLYTRAKRTRSDYFFYFVLDGLMMLSAPLVLLAKFAR